MGGTSGKYDPRLQSLRGLAALTVLFGHASLIMQPTRFLFGLGTIFQQDSAVIRKKAGRE